MIPKKIHYIWIGDVNNIPEEEKCLIEKCKYFHNDWEFNIWNETDVPSNLYLKTCLELNEYSYAADYIRAYILLNHGGFYIDTDVEMLCSIPDEWRGYVNVIPKETPWYISNYIVGSMVNSKYMKELVHMYNEFNGTLDKDHWVAPNSWKDPLVKVFGEYSCINLHNGSWQSTGTLRILEEFEACPYYPWDNNRINNNVDTSKSICIHYWNNYKLVNNIKLSSLSK